MGGLVNDVSTDLARQAPSALPKGARPAKAGAQAKKNKAARAWWLKQLHSWHWISAAVSLAGMFLFAITGLTLNHAASISAKPVVTDARTTVPGNLMKLLDLPHPDNAPLPAPIAAYVAPILHLDPGGRPADWSSDEVYVAMPGPGRDAWVSIERATGVASSERTDRGWISYLNDLHKGRNTGAVWFWFIDVFAVACVLFSVTGLLLLQLHSKRRPLTWPMVALSLVIPLVIAIIFIH